MAVKMSMLFLNSEDEDRMFLQNGGIYLQVHIVLQPRIITSTQNTTD
jgi:hypothetical protein